MDSGITQGFKNLTWLLKLMVILVMTGSTISAIAQNQAGKSNPSAKPNVIFFLVDDMGWTDIGTFGSTFYETPNIDRLAKEGMKFTNAYAACPVCSPTRASIMTGKYPAGMKTTDWFGAPQPEFAKTNAPWNTYKMLPASYTDYLPLAENTLAEVFKANGYNTFIAGKWHLGEKPEYWPQNQGFDIDKGGYSAGHPKSYFSPYYNPMLEDGPPGEYMPERLTLETEKFITDNKDHPFFAYFSFYNVHTPLQAKDSLIKKYEGKRKRLGLSDKFLDEDGNKVRAVQSLPVYAAMVEAVDQAVGKVLQKVEDLGLEKNTIIIFFSDNGGLSITQGTPTSNLPLRGGKGWLYEGGIREPLIIKGPDIQEGSICNTPVISNDFYPTLVNLCGLKMLPQDVEGESLVPLFENGKLKNRALFWHYPHYGDQHGFPGSAIREGKWKLIKRYEDNNIELYDLENDISEKNNLVRKENKVANKMLKRLNAWLKKEHANMPVKNPNYQASSN